MANTYLTRTPSGAGNKQKFTFSVWIKKQYRETGTNRRIISSYFSNGGRHAFLAFGQDDKDIDNESLKRSIEISELNEFFDSLPNGSQTLIGPDGSNLSGGQKQRIGIARALYRNPQILVFDESTNAIDEVLQEKIIKNILNISREKIILFISHDRNLEKHFDYSLQISKSGLKKI